MRGVERAEGSKPRFCPSCRRAGASESLLCPQCGEALVPQGYCGICEGYWPLRAGTPCPKHEVDLEALGPGTPGGPPAEAAPSWVTVRTFADALKAEAPRIRLEAEGIPTFLEGERMGGRSMYQLATGGVKLQVPEPLAADARVLLAQSWTPPSGDDDLDDAWDELAPDPGSVRRSVMKAVIVFLLVAPLLMGLLSLCFRL